jgi:hypothetical protein
LSRVYFTDRDLGKRFPEILRAGGLDVRRHVDLFPPACPDEVWLEDVGRRQWVAVTHDRRIRYKPNEQAAVVIQGEMSSLSARPRRHFPWSDFLTNREDLDMSSEITSSNTMRQDSIAPSH